MQREKHQGVYIYFSDEGARYEDQVRARLEAFQMGPDISDADAVAILVAIIKHHGIEPEMLVKLPEVRAKGISVADIEGFFARHGLKKTIRPRP